MKKVLAYVIATLLFTALGLWANKPIAEFFFSKINLNGYSILNTSIDGPFKAHMWFTASVALLPLLFGLGTAISKVPGLRPNLLIGVLMLACGIISAHFRTSYLSQLFENFSDFTPEGITNTMHISKLHLGEFLLLGLLIGAIAGGYAVKMVAGQESKPGVE